MKHNISRLVTNDGIKLHTQRWDGDTPPRAVVILVHGHGEHSLRYQHWAEKFVDKGIAFLSFDLRGHGLSEGKRGHAKSYDLLLNDVELMINEVEKLYVKIPKILYGHSMGGNIVLNYILRRTSNIQLVIATSPWLELSFQPTTFQMFLAKVMFHIFPAFTQESNLDVDAISHDPEEVRKYREDKLNHGKISAALFVHIHQAGLWAIENAGKLKLPTLVIHGNEDRITSYTASEKFVEKTAGMAKIQIWKEGYHELHNDLEKENVFKNIVEWINESILNSLSR